jgi:hypothetical protein
MAEFSRRKPVTSEVSLDGLRGFVYMAPEAIKCGSRHRRKLDDPLPSGPADSKLPGSRSWRG